MKYVINVGDKNEDIDPRSLRYHVKDREKRVLRDTYYLVDKKDAPSRRLTMGHTTVYPTGSTTGHAHDDMEEIYFVISGTGTMVVGDDEFGIKAGDSLYVPPGAYHTTFQTGILPLTLLWVTCVVDEDER